MIYNETYIGIATNVDELMDILRTKVPGVATIEQANGDRSPDVEVWYDEGTNTVILK
jgi:hypothetical protein